MRAGALRHLISIERATATRDTTGAELQTWAEWKGVYAEVVPASGREYFASQQAHSEHTVRFRLRYLSDVLTTDRVVWNGTTYNVRAVSNVEGLARTTELVCTEQRA